MASKKNYIYCRTSTCDFNEDDDDELKEEALKKATKKLEEQVSIVKKYVSENFKDLEFEVITDIGYCFSYEMPGYNKIIKGMTKHTIDKLILIHKDILLLQYDMLKPIMKYAGVEMINMDLDEWKSSELEKGSLLCDIRYDRDE